MKYKKFSQVSYKTKFIDIFINTVFRHTAKKVVYSADRYLTYAEKDLKSTTIRCQRCFKLNSYSFKNVLYSCVHCKRRV